MHVYVTAISLYQPPFTASLPSYQHITIHSSMALNKKKNQDFSLS